MTFGEILTECRSMADDISRDDSDHIWTDSDMKRYINRIYRLIARETRCIVDSTTPAVVLLSSAPVDYTTYADGTLDHIWANDPDNWLYQKNVAPYLFDLHKSILEVDECRWVNRSWRLRKVTVQKWAQNPWWERVVGMPTEFATDHQLGKLAVNFRDEETDTLHLTVRRMPLVDLKAEDDVPEIRAAYHDFFHDGVLWLMYSKQDSQAFDGQKALAYKGSFMQQVDEAKHLETRLNDHLNANHPMGAFI